MRQPTLREGDSIPGLKERLAFYGTIVEFVEQLKEGTLSVSFEDLIKNTYIGAGMGAGKTGALIEIHQLLESFGYNPGCAKPAPGNRGEGPVLKTRAEITPQEVPCLLFEDAETLERYSNGFGALVIDEEQMQYPRDLPAYLGAVRRISRRIPVLRGGLVFNFGGDTFHSMDVVGALESKLILLHTECHHPGCASDGIYSNALEEGVAKPYDGKEIAPGDKTGGSMKTVTSYVSSCAEHFQEPRRTLDFSRPRIEL